MCIYIALPDVHRQLIIHAHYELAERGGALPDQHVSEMPHLTRVRARCLQDEKKPKVCDKRNQCMSASSSDSGTLAMPLTANSLSSMNILSEAATRRAMLETWRPAAVSERHTPTVAAGVCGRVCVTWLICSSEVILSWGNRSCHLSSALILSKTNSAGMLSAML